MALYVKSDVMIWNIKISVLGLKNTVNLCKPSLGQSGYCSIAALFYHKFYIVSFRLIIQGNSDASGPKLLYIKLCYWDNDLKSYITYRERCKIGPAHNRCWNWSLFTSKHTWMRFSELWNTFPIVEVDGLNLLAYSVFELFDCVGCIFVHFALQ